VTGVAFWDSFMAVSTPNKIVIQYHNPEKKQAKETGVEVGAHGILATPSGRFLAPIGVGGLLEIKPDLNISGFPNLHAPKGRVLNFYSAVSLPGVSLPGDGSETIVCSTRRDGIALVSLPQQDSGGRVRVKPCEGVDVVDVCALGYPDWPGAVAAIGIDCSVFLMKNGLEEVGPLALRFAGMQGNAYRILSARGNLFVLTSEFLYVLTELAHRFVHGNHLEIGGATPVRAIPLRAVDMFLAYDQWLLIILPEYVVSVDIQSFLGESPQGSFINGQVQTVREENVMLATTRPQTNIEDLLIKSDQMALTT
jgi:hypothetical protein